MPIQLPPDSTGKLIETVVVTSSENREVMILGSTSLAYAPVTSSGGLLTSLSSGTVTLSSVHTVTATGPVTVSSGLISVTSGTITSTAATNPWSSAPGFNIPVVSVSSGLIQLSSQITVTATGPVTITSGTVTLSSVHTVTATAGTNPWSSAPGFNIPTVSVSSGLSQVSAIQVSPTSSVAGAGLVVITSSFGLVTQSTQPITITSGTITLSSVHTVTATAATNPWSSAPAFNVPVVTVSSGLVQIAGVPLVVVTTSAFSGIGIVTTAMGPVLVTSSGGPVFSAGVNTAAGYGPVTSSAGRLSSLSSGTVTLSSVHTVTATAGTNPWSSAPGFNIPVVNVSSGLVQISGVPIVILTTSAFSGVGLVTSAMAPISVTSSFGVMVNQTTLKIVPVLAASSGLVSIDLWQGTSSLSPSYIVATTISKVSTAPGSLYALHAYTTAAVGAIIRFYNAGTSSVVMNTSVVAAYLCNAQSTVGMNAIDYSLPPTGWFFATQCSFDVVVTATSTATVYGSPAYVTAGYSTV